MDKNKKGLIVEYDSQYWLSEYYKAEDEDGGFFAAPVFVDSQGNYVFKPVWQNWIFESWGARIADAIENKVKISIYKAWIDRLKFNIRFCMPNRKAHIGNIKRWEIEIEYFEKLIKKNK